MANIVVFQHGRAFTPGRLGMTLRDHAFRLDVRRVDLPADQGGRPVPPDFDNVHGVISLGGRQRVSDNHPWIRAETEFLAESHRRQLPTLGIGLGAQLLARALGAEVGPMEAGPEIGFHPVRILPPGQTETILAGIPWNSHQFHLHADEIRGAPPESTLLAGSDACKVQAFRAGLRTFGFQYHFECDRPMIEACVAEAGGMLADANLTPDGLARQSDDHYAAYARLGDRLSVNTAAFAFTFHELLAV